MFAPFLSPTRTRYSPLHAAAVATHTTTPLDMHTYVHISPRHESIYRPATTGIDLVAGASLPLVFYDLTRLQRGGTPSKTAGFGATRRSREVEHPPRGLPREKIEQFY